jgi:hypothetical protein
VDGEKGFGFSWRFGVSLRLGGDAGWFVWVETLAGSYWWHHQGCLQA